MSIEVINISKIRISSLRIFPLQTRDYAFILYQDLPSSYLLTLLIDKIGFSLSQFSIEYVYPLKKYVDLLEQNITSYKEEYYLFTLENYYHSSDFALGFIENILDILSQKTHNKKIIIHTFKASQELCQKLMEKYPCILLIIRTDIEYFFNDFFYHHTPIEQIANILYRDDSHILHITRCEEVTYPLEEYILGAYYHSYYHIFPKVKDAITSLLDDDNESTDENIYYQWPKKKSMNLFRFSPQTEIMLTSGRGCKYKCSYCYRGIKYSSVRQIPLSVIEKDLQYLQEYGYEYIYFYDDCFITTNLNRMKEIVELLKKYNFQYGIAARYEVCTPEILDQLSQIHITRMQIGLQSISMDVNKESKRGFHLERFQKTMTLLKQKGINISLDIILGLPGEGLKGFIKTFNFALSLQPISIFINSLFLNPGTELYEKKEQYGIITQKQQDAHKNLFHVSSLYSSNDFSSQDIQMAKKYVSYYREKRKDIMIILR